MAESRTVELMRQQRERQSSASMGGEAIDGDWSEADVKKLIPAKTWVPVEVIKNTFGKTASTDKRKVDLEFKIIDGEYAGQHLYKMYILEGKAASMFLSLCDACGQYDRTNKRPTATKTSLLKQKLWLLVDIEPERLKDDRFPDGEKWAARNIVAPWESHEPFTARATSGSQFGAPVPKASDASAVTTVDIPAEQAEQQIERDPAIVQAVETTELAEPDKPVKKDWGDDDADDQD